MGCAYSHCIYQRNNVSHRNEMYRCNSLFSHRSPRSLLQEIRSCRLTSNSEPPQRPQEICKLQLLPGTNPLRSRRRGNETQKLLELNATLCNEELHSLTASHGTTTGDGHGTVHLSVIRMIPALLDQDCRGIIGTKIEHLRFVKIRS